METARKVRVPQPERRPDGTTDASRPVGRQTPGDEVAPVIARIREDARLEPRRWLDESEVKAGGE